MDCFYWGIFIPFIPKIYLIPLIFCTSVFNRCKTAAMPESPSADACHAIRDYYIFKSSAAREGTLANARYTVRNCDACKTAAVAEGSFTDTCHAIRYCHTRKTAAQRESITPNAFNIAGDYYGFYLTLP